MTAPFPRTCLVTSLFAFLSLLSCHDDAHTVPLCAAGAPTPSVLLVRLLTSVLVLRNAMKQSYYDPCSANPRELSAEPVDLAAAIFLCSTQCRLAPAQSDSQMSGSKQSKHA